MKQKIIQVACKTCEEVLLAVVRDTDDGEDYVEISAWHTDAEGMEYYHLEAVTFKNIERCERFITDYSEESALEFVESFHF